LDRWITAEDANQPLPLPEELIVPAAAPAAPAPAAPPASRAAPRRTVTPSADYDAVLRAAVEAEEAAPPARPAPPPPPAPKHAAGAAGRLSAPTAPARAAAARRVRRGDEVTATVAARQLARHGPGGVFESGDLREGRCGALHGRDTARTQPERRAGGARRPRPGCRRLEGARAPAEGRVGGARSRHGHRPLPGGQERRG